jgi:hypothetical protein
MLTMIDLGSVAVRAGLDNQSGMAKTLPAPPVDLEEINARAAEFGLTSHSAATERADRSD